MENKLTTEFEKYISEWIVNDLDTPVPLLNNMPKCPFAKKALLENKIKFFENKQDTLELIQDIINHWDNNIEVAIIKIEDNVTSDDLSRIAIEANERHPAFLILDDHLDVEEKIKDVDFSNNKYNILLCQKRDKIVAARKMLQKNGYYKNWDEHYYNSVVSL